MSDALLFGGGIAPGIRIMPILKDAYDKLPEEKKNNPKIIWMITDVDDSSVSVIDYENTSDDNNMLTIIRNLSERVTRLESLLNNVQFNVTNDGELNATYEVADEH